MAEDPGESRAVSEEFLPKDFNITMASILQDRRAGRLVAVFREVLEGKRQVNSPTDAKQFIEAIQAQQPPSVCIEKIISSPAGLNALRTAVRADLSPLFVLSNTFKFLNYLADPSIKALANGEFLQRILGVITKPPTLWQCLMGMYAARDIPQTELRQFAWLVLEVISVPSMDFVADAKAVMQSDILMNSSSFEARELGYKIRKVLQIKSSAVPLRLSDGSSPGGRHDNDHTDFRDTAIYPTTDEVLSTAEPYYLTVDEVFATDQSTRVGVHLDNQFRLLREDMLAELREDLQIAMGKKSSKRKPLVLGGFDPIALYFGDESRGKPSKRCCLKLRCFSGLSRLKYNLKSEEQRRKFLKETPSFLKHQAFGVMFRGTDILGFAFVEREIDLLCQEPPVVLLQFTDSDALCKSLMALKKPTDIKFAIVDTPVFAYEPVLTGLKKIADLPLQEHLLGFESERVAIEPAPAIQNLIEQLQSLKKNKDRLFCLPNPKRRLAGDDLSVHELDAPASGSGATKSVMLDDSQLKSLINALRDSVTLIQGPPGESLAAPACLI
jgi:hypothetical protein